MPYIGNTAADRFVASKAATQFSGDGSTTAFTLDHAVGSDEDILVSVDGVIQEPSVAYAVSSGTTLTFTAAPSSNSGNNIFVYYLFRTVATVDHPATSALSATSGTFSAGVSGTTGTFTGNVGIGVTTANAKLSLPAQASGDSGVARFAIESAVDSNDFTIAQYEDSNGTYTQIGQNVSLNSGGSTIVLDSGHKTASIMFDGRGNGSLAFQTGGTNTSTENMKIDSAGHVTMPNQTAFGAIGSSAPTLPINTTYVLPLDTERFDQNGDYNTSNYTFTAPVTGRYQLNGSIYLYNYLDTSAGYIMFTLRTSNDEYQYPVQASMFGSDIGSFGMNISHLVDMDASDTAVIDIFQQAGAAQTSISGGHSHFTGFLVA
jgi:hypothetical protein